MAASIAIEELAIPADPGATSFNDYARALAVRNAHEIQVLGSAARYTDPVEALPAFQDQTHLVQRLFAGRFDGEIVAHALLRWSTAQDTRIAWAFGEVLPAARRRGMGTALFDHVEGIAAAAGRTVIQSFALHEAVDGGERLPSPTGFGSLPLRDPGTGFLRGRGYELGQIQRISLMRLPVPPARLGALARDATARAGDLYALEVWTGETPRYWLADVAVLLGSSETDAPRGALQNEPEAWDAERVRAEDAHTVRGGRLAFAAAAVHRPTGRLAGVTRLSVPADRTQPARQHTTIVLREHRGHRLGLWMKLANLRQLVRAVPESTAILASNAEDNRYMLDVNEALGFVPVAHGGAWTRRLA